MSLSFIWVVFAVPQESMQGSSDETANSGEEGSSSGRSEASSNEAGSSRASQSAGSPGSELHSDDLADSEALKEEEEEEEEEEDDDEDDEDDDEDDEDDRPGVASEGSPQKETRDSREPSTSELRKRKAGEALGEIQGPPERPGIPGSITSTPGLSKTKSIPFTPETAAAMVASSSLRILEPCFSSSVCMEGTSGEQADPSSHSQSQNPQQPQPGGSEMGSSHGASVSQEPPCMPRPADFLTEAMSNELFNCRRFISPQHHHHHHHHHHDGWGCLFNVILTRAGTINCCRIDSWIFWMLRGSSGINSELSFEQQMALYALETAVLCFFPNPYIYLNLK